LDGRLIDNMAAHRDWARTKTQPYMKEVGEEKRNTHTHYLKRKVIWGPRRTEIRKELRVSREEVDLK